MYNYPAETQNIPTVEDILDEVCKIFDLTPEKVKSKGRKTPYLYCRYITAHVCYSLEIATYKKIGEALNRDHSSVVIGHQNVKDWMDTKDPSFMYYWNKFISESKIWYMNENKQIIHKYWMDSVKSAIANNNSDYATASWVQLETGKPIKKCRHELNKLIELGFIFKITSNLGVRYKLSNKQHI